MKPEEKTKRFYEIVTNLANMYAKKNTDYGDSFGKLYDDLGPTAGLVPLYNKLHRITSVIKNNNTNFESLEDSFKDLACYAIMNLIEIEAQKDKKCCSASILPEYINCETYKANKGKIDAVFSKEECFECKHTTCPYHRPSYINLTWKTDIAPYKLTNQKGETDNEK